MMIDRDALSYILMKFPKEIGWMKWMRKSNQVEPATRQSYIVDVFNKPMNFMLGKVIDCESRK